MRWQKSVFGAVRDTLSAHRAAPESLLSGGRWQLFTAQGWVGVSVAAGGLRLCTQNSTSPFTGPGSEQTRCGVSPGTFIVEGPGEENAQGKAGAAVGKEELEIQSPTL